MTFPLKKTLAVLLAGLTLTASASAMTKVPVSALEPHGTGLKMRNWLTNDPNYTFSEAYQTSVWYQNFSSLRLSENQRNNVLRIAISQIGYHEGDSAQDFNGMNTKGTGNYMEYARLLVPHYSNNAYEWCACFVNWCLNQARFDKASSEISCGNWVKELQGMNMWQSANGYGGTYTPKPADLIFFDWDETGKWPDHVGLVLYATATHVYTIEGNTKTNDVGMRSYSLDDKRIMGFGTPPYEEGNEATMDFSYAAGMPSGVYVVTERGSVLTDQNGQNPSDSVPVGSSVTFQGEVGDLVHVSYKGKNGYLPKTSVCLMTQSFTLSYDANGGLTPPYGMTAHQAVSASISQRVPTLQGDTFLGWSTVPYNCKVDYKPGDSIMLTGDTVLYAVWEKRSVELAKAAAAEGYLPEYERPDTVQNSSALLLDTLNDNLLFSELFSEFSATELKYVEDETMGAVPAFYVSGDSVQSYAILDYKRLYETLELEPVAGEDAAYAILRVKEAKGGAASLQLSFNGGAATGTQTLAQGASWQYVVFDLSNFRFDGELASLRLEWLGAAGAPDTTLLLGEIWLAPNEAVRDAILDGKYVFASRIVEKEVETEPQTEAQTEPATLPQPDEDQKPSDDADPGDTEVKEDTTERTPVTTTPTVDQQTEEAVVTTSAPAADTGSGCNSTMGVAVSGAVTSALAAVALRKKKETDEVDS